MTSPFLEYLAYDADTGNFTWRKSPGGRARAGSVAGVLQTHGYRQIKLRGVRQYAHRLAWWFAYGREPAGEIDHINGCRDDNRINNLRECTRSENLQNLSVARGTYFDRRRGKWVAEISAFGRKHYLGSFDDELSARLAYLNGKRAYHRFAPEVRV